MCHLLLCVFPSWAGYCCGVRFFLSLSGRGRVELGGSCTVWQVQWEISHSWYAAPAHGNWTPGRIGPADHVAGRLVGVCVPVSLHRQLHKSLLVKIFHMLYFNISLHRRHCDMNCWMDWFSSLSCLQSRPWFWTTLETALCYWRSSVPLLLSLRDSQWFVSVLTKVRPSVHGEGLTWWTRHLILKYYLLLVFQ